MKKAWVMILSVLMLVTMSTTASFAESTTKTSAHTDTFSFENGKSLKNLKKEAKQYPSSFDLRHVDTDGDGKADSSFVTPVKVQNPYGTCWGFAAAATAESSILSNSKLNRDEKGKQLWSTSMDQHYNAENKGGDGLPMLDLSEKQFAYFSTSYLNDPGNPQNGEGMHYRKLTKEDKETSAYRYNKGGYNIYATTLFASGTGPAVERDPDGSYNGILVYRGKNKKKAVRENAVVAYDANNKPAKKKTVPVWYSDKDDWSMPEVSRLLQDYSLKDSFVLPTPAGSNSDGGYEYVPAGTLAIKQQLCEHNRAVSITYHAEAFLPGQDTTESEFMSSHWAHYTNQKDLTNHLVTIVGWDDNYPKENFKIEPPGNGAWLVKNSWGSELNEFPNNGYRHWGLLEGEDKVPYDKKAKSTSMKATGYFWLSYYDQTLESPETFEFDRAVSGYYVEQMDYLQVVDTIKSEAKGCKMANVFQAREKVNLSGFSVMTQTPGTKVDYEIYLLPDKFKNPQDGKKVAKGTETFEYGGYHKINLRNEQQRVLEEGQKYSVVIRESSETGDYVNYGADNSDGTVEIVAIINPGESYYYDGKHWNDQSKKKTQDMLIPSVYKQLGLDEGLLMDNFPIKAYVEPITQKDKTGETTTKNLYSGPGAKVKAKGKKKLIIYWPKVKTANGYEVYLSKSNKAVMKKVKTIKGNKTFKWTKAGLKKGKLYKVCVKAYRMEKGKKIYVMKSPVMYSYTGGSKKYTNAKSVKVEKSMVTLKAGKTSKIKAKVRKLKKSKKLVSSKRVAKLRYLSSNPGVAKVAKSGKITAVKKGKCKVYVYAHNGVYKTVAVTVR